MEILSRVVEGSLPVAQAAALLGISERQAWRLKRRYASGGDAGLMHKLRGRRSNHKTDQATRDAVLKIYRSQYAGFGPTLACEYLAADDGWEVSPDTLGRWLRAEGLFEPRRRRSKHRLRRPRRSCLGELVQMDGSWHDWFEGRGPSNGQNAHECCLMVMIDDATGRVLARFYEKETLSAAFDLFGQYAGVHGLPRALYVDKAGIYRSEEGMAPTQFGRAMETLGVELILANSPQAKGRVERMNATLQDRLVKEMRLRGVKTMVQANALLKERFLKSFNSRFAVTAKSKTNVHRVVKPAMRLDEVLCEQEERAVGHDWCVQWRGRLLQIDEKHLKLDLPRAGRRVVVIEKADGNLLVRYADKALTWAEMSKQPARAKAKKAKKPVANNKRYVPGPDHPFNKTPACPGSRSGVRPSSAAPPRV